MIGSLSLIDILFIVTVLFLAYNGFATGAITSLVNLLGIPLGLAVAYFFGPQFTKLLAADGFSATPLVSYIILFFGTVLIVHIVGSLFGGFIRHVPIIGFGNRLLGIVVGFVEAWLLWVILLFVLHNFLMDIHNIPGGIDTNIFNGWQQFYNTATTHSLFAQVNSFIIKQLPNVK